MGCHFLLQGIFPIQGSNPDLLHCRQILQCLSRQGSPMKCWPSKVYRQLMKPNIKKPFNPIRNWAKHLNRCFSEKDMSKRHMKSCSASLITRAMQIKTTERYHQSEWPSKNLHSQCWRECGEKGTLLHCSLECKQVQPLWKTVRMLSPFSHV